MKLKADHNYVISLYANIVRVGENLSAIPSIEHSHITCNKIYSLHMQRPHGGNKNIVCYYNRSQLCATHACY